MRKVIPMLAFAAACSRPAVAPTPKSPGLAPPEGWQPAAVARYVNPMIGTKGGETWPGAVVPFGMVQWSPENTKGNSVKTARPGGYGYDFTRMRGLALTHMSGHGCAGAYGDVPFFPHVGEVTTSPSDDRTDAIYASDFSHGQEKAVAGRYQVTLASGAAIDLSATTRTGVGRFTWPAGQPATLLVRTSSSEVGSEDASATIDPATRTISGWVRSGNFCGYLSEEGVRSYYTLYFHAELDQDFVATGGWTDATVTPGALTAQGGTGYGEKGWPPAGKGSGVWVTFAKDGVPVNVRVGISFVSAANAKANLAAESPPGTTLESVAAAAFRAWNDALARIEIEGGSADQKTTFYTALYHSLLHPNVFSDVNGEYTGMDQKVHTVAAPQRLQYANFSGWDVYRGQLQLVTLVDSQVAGDIAQSLLNQADQYGGVWDRWTHGPGATHVMTGDPSAIAIASMVAFGSRNFDVRRAFASLLRAATVPTELDLSNRGAPVMSVGQRPSLDKYLALGFVPADGNAWGGAGETLEDASADFALAQLAARLGDRVAHDQLLARASTWKNVFNPAATPEAGYIQDRFADGRWRTPFDPSGEKDEDAGFAEGSSAQYTWMVPHDARGLFDAMGGDARAIARLDAFFRTPDGVWALTRSGGLHAEMNNEPSIGAAYLYSFAGAPHKTQETVRAVIDTLWRNGPDGIPGQDDLGAMSAWYVWSALGLYPNYPGRAELLVTAPLFAKATIRRANRVTLTIAAPAAATGAAYVRGASLDGQAWTRAWLPEAFVGKTATLTVDVSDQPAPAWGAATGDRPPSFSK
jgi:predicted alpha-1,2-mannosidase